MDDAPGDAVPVVMYATGGCVFCLLARRLLKKKGVAFQEIRVDRDPEQWDVMEARSGRHTVPQVFAGERHLGGYSDLAELDRAGELDAALGCARPGD